MSDESVVSFNLLVSEANTLLQILGDQPTKTGLWPLLMKIKDQAEKSLLTPSTDDLESVA